MFRDYTKIALFSGLLIVFSMTKLHAQAPNYQQVLESRIAPVGEVNVSGAPIGGPAQAVLSGKERYEASCGFCHDAGVAGSPKLGSKAAWSARIAQGESVLVQHAINGIGTMPAKGMCPTCSDDEIKSAVEYMISQVK